ncbi:MAG: ATP-binding protein [Chloroflexi bacterium]|nr:ATP-binding protein [Chloroflexota bacterium]MCI0577113.1 ATP-binding protein [Chloroflexota bacterium]MCI0646844.1 ATP-binding protein [Chloroflexota bacterium]MCI0726957.1 ATP-binding protein [Chloroflexota bacterium]
MAGLTLVDFLRHRERARLDIAAMFGSLAVAILVGQFRAAAGLEAPWLQTLGAMAIMAQPYLLLRLVYHFRPIPRSVNWIGLAGLVVSWGIFIANLLPLLPALILVIVAYFVIIEGYATVAMVRGALATGGVTRRRLTLAATGSGLLATLILLAGVSAVLPSLADLVGSFGQLLAALAALSYYLGFAPPRWLRRAWQLAELYRFLGETTGRAIVESPAAILDRLCRTGGRVTGSLATVVALWDEAENGLKIQATHGRPAATTDTLSIGEGAVGRAWRERRPAVASTLADFGSAEAVDLATAVGAGALLAVPMAAAGQAWGLLLAFPRSSPLFAADDLALLALLAEQSAIALDYITLLAEQRAAAAQLKAANKELEAFAYSVSHDLRAPLRVIDGFSEALLEDCAEQLDEQGKVYLERVRANTQRMGELIDALLTLSRVTRVEMSREPVDLSVLARSIAAGLQQREPQRQVEFVIESGLVVEGDAHLLHVALENLLNNAWKFSGKRPLARIEFGVLGDEAQATYFVRDDGAGFDMTYADKLFGAFQRLHSMSDFSGTGIGLATVQRIIHRHGGRVWAEGVLNQGATFYFTF